MVHRTRPSPRRRAAGLLSAGLALLLLAACAAPGAAPSRSARVSMAAIFSGPVDDADFNAVGLSALRAVAAEGLSTEYTQRVAVPDAEQILRRYAADGNDILWAHGGQFYPAAAVVARAYPHVTVIAEFDGHPPDQPANLWVLDRQFHLGYYAIGVLAAQMSSSHIVGYVGGLPLPYSHAEVHAIEQAFADTSPHTQLRTAWTGNFNDVDAAKRTTARLISGGADVILGSLNGGAVGIFQAAAEASADASHPVWVTTKYADKSALDAGRNGIATLVYDFAWPLRYVVAKIANNERTGYYPMGFAAGVDVSMADTVPAGAQQAVRNAIAAISAGRITVTLDASPVN